MIPREDWVLRLVLHAIMSVCTTMMAAAFGWRFAVAYAIGAAVYLRRVL